MIMWFVDSGKIVEKWDLAENWWSWIAMNLQLGMCKGDCWRILMIKDQMGKDFIDFSGVQCNSEILCVRKCDSRDA